ncbi:MAG: DUF3341 domain-containing protein [Phycisphaerales bacterium]|nr:DUF3341 domain-containing protein [bacterium]
MAVIDTHNAREIAPEEPSYYGIMAEFDDIPAIFEAAQKCRDHGFTKWDVYAPVPIHGIDEAMGMKGSKVAFCMGAGALTGLTIAFLMQWWFSAGSKLPGLLDVFSGYEIITHGKPFFAWEQAVPIMFELTVLLSAFATIGGMLALNGLPRWYHPLFKKDRFLRVSDDRLVIAIEAKDPKFDQSETKAFLESVGGNHIELVEE